MQVHLQHPCSFLHPPLFPSFDFFQSPKSYPLCLSLEAQTCTSHQEVGVYSDLNGKNCNLTGCCVYFCLGKSIKALFFSVFLHFHIKHLCRKLIIVINVS